MIGSVAEIKEASDRLESMIRALVDDRERAWAEVARLKKALDDREMEFLQMDEEYRNAVKKFEEERVAMAADREDMERTIDEVASRIRGLLPILPEVRSEQTPGAGQSSLF